MPQTVLAVDWQLSPLQLGAISSWVLHVCGLSAKVLETIVYRKTEVGRLVHSRGSSHSFSILLCIVVVFHFEPVLNNLEKNRKSPNWVHIWEQCGCPLLALWPHTVVRILVY